MTNWNDLGKGWKNTAPLPEYAPPPAPKGHWWIGLLNLAAVCIKIVLKLIALAVIFFVALITMITHM